MKSALSLLLFPVRGGILSLVLVVGLVVALLMTSLILLAHYYRGSYLAFSLEDRLEQNADSGIAYLMATETFQDSSVIDLYGSGIDSVLVQKKTWGVYRVLRAVAFASTSAVSKIMLQGHEADGYGKAALYLTDENKPLSISGNSIVKGDCYLPKAGIRTAQIEGKGYAGNKLVYGSIGESQSTLPPLNQEFTKQWENILVGGIPEGYAYSLLNTLPDTLSQSFAKRTLLFEAERDQEISHALSGNIMLVSQGTVTFTAAADIKDILVFARKVIIKEGFTGKLQVFASDTIQVEENCRLLYPSTLIIKTSKERSLIHIDVNSQIEGIVLSSGNKSASNRIIHIAKDSKIYGQVYSDGLIEVRGSLYGHLACRKFVLMTPSSVYENHLLDAEINAQKLPEEYLGSSLWWSSTKKGIIKWLN